VLDQAMRDKTLDGLVDEDKVGVLGHSFGAYTAMVVAGATVDLPDGKASSFRDARVKAVLPMSPEGPGTMGLTLSSWDRFAVPGRHLTGSRDYGAGQRSATWRRAGYEHVQGVDDYLVTLEGAGHMTFADLPGSKDDAEGQDDARATLRRQLRERFLAAAGGNDTAQPVQHERHVAMIRSLDTAFFDPHARPAHNTQTRPLTLTLPTHHISH